MWSFYKEHWITGQILLGQMALPWKKSISQIFSNSTLQSTSDKTTRTCRHNLGNSKIWLVIFSSPLKNIPNVFSHYEHFRLMKNVTIKLNQFINHTIQMNVSFIFSHESHTGKLEYLLEPDPVRLGLAVGPQVELPVQLLGQVSVAALCKDCDFGM